MGIILDWWRPTPDFNIPISFDPCDGSLISNIYSPYNNYNTPNLSDKFILSTTNLSQINTTGGQNTIDFSHAHSSTNHYHGYSHGHSVGLDWNTVQIDTQLPDTDPRTFARYHHNHGVTGVTHSFNTSSNNMGFNSQTISLSNIPSYLGVLKLLKTSTGTRVKVNNPLHLNLILDNLSGFPLGTIINWWVLDIDNPYTPINYATCNGVLIVDTSSRYYGLTTPDLRDRFIRGVTSDRIGEYGGDNSQNWYHQHYVPDHSHDSTHGPTYTQTPQDQGGGDPWRTEAGANVGIALPGHHHTLTLGQVGMSASGIYYAGTLTPRDAYTSGSGSSYNNRPSYYRLMKLVKIK